MRRVGFPWPLPGTPLASIGFVNLSWRVVAAAVFAVFGSGVATLRGSVPDPFAFLAPAIRVTPTQAAALDAGTVIVRALPADDGHLGVFAAARLEAGPDALMAWTRAIDDLVRGPLVSAAGRFSDAPVEADLAGLVLDDYDLEGLRGCRAADCRVKLSEAEIRQVQAAIGPAGADWRVAAASAFRRILIGRVVGHRASGLAAMPPDADHRRPASRHEAFAAIVARSPYLAAGLPQLASALEAPSQAGIPGSESLNYWSKEHYGAGKAVIGVTHVRFWKSDAGHPAAVAASTQIFASHYLDAARGLTMVLCETGDTPCYLAYIQRTRVDLFGGLLGGIKRSIARQRIESQAPALIGALRDRLQTAAPTW
jgi:hypothetical protein